jgi:adenine-specific DNA-methyltransferase
VIRSEDGLTLLLSRKQAGAYYTPDPVVSTLLRWVVRDKSDRLLDPSCGDGRFIAGHRNSVGIEQDFDASRTAKARAPWALVHEGDFFAWAAETSERFECAAGNPPFIRYQTFKGEMRARALSLCAGLGADFSGLASSWAPFLVAAASLLRPGGRMAFVVPAEVGHAPYAAPLLEYLIRHFSKLQVVAVRDKLFPELSEDCWLLYADGFGGSTQEIRFSVLDHFRWSERPSRKYFAVSVNEWRTKWNRRLRPFLISQVARDLYRRIAQTPTTLRFGDLATVGIGYVSGANDFFHLRPSDAKRWNIPAAVLHPSVRNGRALPASRLTLDVVEQWKRNDDAILLLKLPKMDDIASAVRRYLDTEAGRAAREAYKCRARDPWYSVPDVQVPDFFLSYMSGREPNLVRNDARCTCTNSVHSVRLKGGAAKRYFTAWGSAFVQLSCELEGHPLGGGMLKLEPREAQQIILPDTTAIKHANVGVIKEAIQTMRAWRHYGEA